MTSFLRRFWDGAYAADEHREHWELPGPAPELETLLSEAAPAGPGLAVDLGCGGGRDAIFLAQRGFRTVGVDVSPAALAIGRRRAARSGVRVAWCCARATQLPLADASARLVTDRGCFHTLEGPARDHYAAEVARVLLPGGVLFLRGSRAEREEEGLWAVDEAAVDRHLRPRGLVPVLMRPLVLSAPAGDLEGCQVVLRRG